MVARHRYLAERGSLATTARWRAATPFIGSISSVRLWGVQKHFFLLAADAIEADHPPLAGKLRRASPRWMCHTHATHAQSPGAEFTTVRDNLRPASGNTSSIYLHNDEVKRA